MDDNSHEDVFVSDKILIFFYTKPNYARRHVASGLHPQMKNRNKTRRHKLLMPRKQCLCYIWHSWKPYLNIKKFHERGLTSKSSAPPIPLKLRPHKRQHFETKTNWYLPSLTPCEAFLITLHFTCMNENENVCNFSNHCRCYDYEWHLKNWRLKNSLILKKLLIFFKLRYVHHFCSVLLRQTIALKYYLSNKFLILL